MYLYCHTTSTNIIKNEIFGYTEPIIFTKGSYIFVDVLGYIMIIVLWSRSQELVYIKD